MAKQLLIEHSVFKPTININEGVKNNNGNLIVVGKIQAADKPNANKRIYPYETLYEQVEAYKRGPIAENRALGELDHPESSVVNLKNVSHNILDLWWQDKDLYGRIEILPTPSGNILRQLFENNITVGISSRAMGSVTPLGEGLVQVEDDLEIVCWDYVSNPSTYGAYMHPEGRNNLKESIEYHNDKYDKVNSLLRDIICQQSGICCLR